MDCKSTINKAVCVEAMVTLAPDVDVGDIRSQCFEEPHIVRCPGPAEDECTFLVSQLICVKIPLTFKALAEVQSTGIVCDVPWVDCCEPEPPDCEPEPPPRGRHDPEDDGQNYTSKNRRRGYAARAEDESGRAYYRYPRDF